MSGKDQLYTTFIHRLRSPLTNIGILLGLLRQSLQDADPDLQDWLTALQSNSDRLNEQINLLVKNIQIDDGALHIDVPASLLVESPHVPSPRAAPVVVAEGLPATQTEQGTVLVIEDSALFRSYLGGFLRNIGFEVIEADDGEVGLDRARQNKPDLIILDYVLPMVHGQQLAHVLRDDPETRDIPLIVCTAMDEGKLELDPHVRVVQKSPDLSEIHKLALQLLADRRRAEQTQILLVEDDAELRSLVASGLRGEGMNVIEATTGEQALLLAQRQQIDMILLDLMLPDMDGFEILLQLRRSNRSLLMPIILLSVIDAPAQKVRGLQLGADDYVTKPFVLEELLARIRAALRRHQLESSANPSTMLPGNVAIDRALTARIAAGEPFAVGYADLDNFKAYNDTYGFLKGDAIIRQTARLLTSVLDRQGNQGDFVGHIGGDDFVFMTSPELVRQICETLLAEFDQVAPLYYDTEARARGYIDQVDRLGKLMRFPLVSISIGVVTNVNRPINHPAEISDIAAELKKYAKRQSGSSYIIDRRHTPTGDLTQEESNFKLPVV